MPFWGSIFSVKRLTFTQQNMVHTHTPAVQHHWSVSVCQQTWKPPLCWCYVMFLSSENSWREGVLAHWNRIYCLQNDRDDYPYFSSTTNYIYIVERKYNCNISQLTIDYIHFLMFCDRVLSMWNLQMFNILSFNEPMTKPMLNIINILSLQHFNYYLGTQKGG